MLTFLQHNVLLSQALTGLLVVVLAALVLWIALRPEQDEYEASHRRWVRSWRLRGYAPRHAAVTYHAHHAAVDGADAGLGVFLARTPGGDLALVDGEQTAELVGAAA